MSIQDKYSFCRAFTKRHEGGYVNNPHDPGKATNFGITMPTLANFRGVSVTEDDILNLTVGEADAIYKQFYYDPAQCDSLPPALACIVFDAAINSGIYRSVSFLQAALGVAQDGQIGAQTINAANHCDPVSVGNAALQWRLLFLEKLPTWEFFENGWKTRVNDLSKYILTA
jgi:lysozyme family protein